MFRIPSIWSKRQPGWPSWCVHCSGTYDGPVLRVPIVLTLYPACDRAHASGTRYPPASATHPAPPLNVEHSQAYQHHCSAQRRTTDHIRAVRAYRGFASVPQPHVMESPSGSHNKGVGGGGAAEAVTFADGLSSKSIPLACTKVASKRSTASNDIVALTRREYTACSQDFSRRDRVTLG